MSIENVVKSAARVLEVFEFFAGRRAAASVSDVCAALGYPQSSTSVLLKSLMTLGYLSYDPGTRRYLPTHRIALLGNWLPSEASELPALLRNLHQSTGGLAFVGQLNGGRVQRLQSVDDSAASGASAGRGDRESVMKSAAGRMLLATLSDGHMLRIVRRAAAQDGIRVDERALLDAIADARRQGYAVIEDESAQTAQIATLASQSAGATPLAIGIVVALERYRSNATALFEALRSTVGLNGGDGSVRGLPAEFPRSGAAGFGGGMVASFVRSS